MIENIKGRISILKKVTPFEYYQAITNGMEYNEDGDALSDVNPQAKWITCKEASNFAIKLKLVDGTEATSAKAEDIDWSLMHKVNQDVYRAAWETVMEGKEPSNDEELLVKQHEEQDSILQEVRQQGKICLLQHLLLELCVC